MTTSLRSLLRSPWFTVIATSTIALGIGTNAAIFSIVNRVLFWPLPYTDADRLVWISTWNSDRGQYSKSSGFDFDAWRNKTTLFEQVEAYWDRPYTFTGTEHPEGLPGWQFTPGLFSMLGATPALGRTFVQDDGLPGRDNVIVLSDALWRRRFGARANIVGNNVELDGRSFIVAGVMPATFAHPYPDTQLWTPLSVTTDLRGDRKQRPLRVIARLKEGVTREQAEAELRSLAQQQARDFPDTHTGFSVAIRPIRALYIGDVSSLLLILQGTAAVLLLIAAANVASLVLVRASSKQRDTAIRLALGAGRMQLWRLHLGEGLVLAVLGSLAGLMLAAWGTQVLPYLLETRLRSLPLPTSMSEWLDSRVLAATAVSTLVIALMFAATPLLRRKDALVGALHSSGRSATSDRRTWLLRNLIVAGQIALCVTLLVGAGLLVRSFARLQDRTFGFRTEGIMTAQLSLPRDRYKATEQSARFLEQTVAELSALPGVESAAAISTLPLTGFNASRPYNLPGQPPQERFTEFRIVTPEYFRAMDIPLRRGRVFEDRDRVGALDVVVVNETVAKRLWPNADPIGQTVMVPDMLTPTPKTVVGVVGDTRHHDLTRSPEPEIYRPAYQTYWPFFGLVVRSQTAPDALERSIRDAAARADRNVPLSGFKKLDDLASTTWAWRRSSMTVLGIFAAAACFLAFVGVYGVMSYSVSQRSREIGVRLALGARPADVARSILRQGTLLTAAGMAAGFALAAALGGLLKALLVGVTPLDFVTFAAVALVTVCAGALATLLPALGAARTDPTMALRGE